jgi:MFS family permease
LYFIARPRASVAVLLVGRTLTGGAESLIITGGMLWGLGRLPPKRSAQVIAWIGMSMFAAMAIGAPIGSALFTRFAFEGIAVASIVLPLASLAFIAPLRSLKPILSERVPMTKVFGAVLLPGVGFALAGITFGSITAFLTLYFAARGWGHGAFAFSAFAVALIAMRVMAGDLPDRLGGARVALYCLGIQALGLIVIGAASAEWIAVGGAIVAGAGFSLVFPSLGLEAVSRVAPASRGMAMGTYNAFLDLTLGIGSPALGFLAGKAEIGAVFYASAVTAVLAVPVAFHLMRSPADKGIHQHGQ